MAHAQLSPSSASRWMQCPGSVALSANIPNTSSRFADEGTAAHELAAKCLTDGTSVADCIGLVIPVGEREFTVDEDMAEYVGGYVSRVRALVESLGGELLVEQRLSISGITGEDGAFGTSDAVILLDDEIIIVDLKYGQGVRVDAIDNPQLRIYALAALNEFDILGTVERVRMIIDQPRKQHLSEEAISVEELRAFGHKVTVAAKHCEHATTLAEMPDDYLNPGEKQCQFCPAKAICPKLRDEVISLVFDAQPATPEDFDAIEAVHTPKTDMSDWLGASMAKVGLVEDWCKAVRAEVETRLLAGGEIPGFKLVEGRKGARAWESLEEAEAALKAMRLKAEQMYDFKLISPTTAEKLAKAGEIGPRQWPKLQDLITQVQGKPSVAPTSDKRPALVITATADDFDSI